MKSVIKKIVLVGCTVSLVVLIMLVSCSKPVMNEQTELLLQSEELDQAPQQEFSEKEEYETQPVPTSVTQTVSGFLEYLDSTILFSAQQLVLTEEFVAALNEYQHERFDKEYKDEPEPAPIVQVILNFMNGCVGGNYIYGAQGDLVTRKLVFGTNRIHPEYLTAGRLEYYLDVADRNNIEIYEKTPRYPYDYAWDCSGLWWDCCNALKLYEEYTDRTASQTYSDFCTPITKQELMPGDLLFYRNLDGVISHMGIMGRNGYIYEAASGFVGVVSSRSLNIRVYIDVVRGGYLLFPAWNEFGRPIIYQ